MKMTRILITFTTGVLGAVVLGAVTNMVNGAVSPTYFRNVMGWHDITDIWRASIAQGILEGAVAGVLLSLLLTGALFIFAKGDVSNGVIARLLLGVLGFAFMCWLVGGMLGVGLAVLSPEMFQRRFMAPPGVTGSILRFAWVGGTIWGIQIGGLVGVVLSIVMFRNHQRLSPD